MTLSLIFTIIPGLLFFVKESLIESQTYLLQNHVPHIDEYCHLHIKVVCWDSIIAFVSLICLDSFVSVMAAYLLLKPLSRLAGNISDPNPVCEPKPEIEL